MEQVIIKIIMLGLLGLTGFIAGRIKYLPDSAGEVLSRVVIKLTAPILIVCTMASKSFNVRDLQNGLWIYFFGLIFLLLAFFISIYSCKAMNLEGATANAYQMQAMFGNVIFLAYPLISSLSISMPGIFGEKALIYAIFYNLANDTLLWTLGIYLVNKHKTTNWKENLKHLVNGNTIAFGIGLLIIILKLLGIDQYIIQYGVINNLLKIVYDTLSPLGNTTIYLSMVFIGLILAEVRISGLKDLAKRYRIFVLAFSKLLLIPMLAFAVFYFFGEFLHTSVKSIVIIQMAMPCATIVTALASQYESDYQFATEAVFISTLMSIVTLPVMVSCVQMFG